MSQVMFHKKTVEEKRRDREERAKKEKEESEKNKQLEKEQEKNTKKQKEQEQDEFYEKLKKNNAIKPQKEVSQSFNRFAVLSRN
jgi:hypothetical protein